MSRAERFTGMGICPWYVSCWGCCLVSEQERFFSCLHPDFGGSPLLQQGELDFSPAKKDFISQDGLKSLRENSRIRDARGAHRSPWLRSG